MSARAIVTRRGRLRQLAAFVGLMALAAVGSLMSVPEPASAAQGEPAVIAVGWEHTCAIENGKAYCWGSNWSPCTFVDRSNYAALSSRLSNAVS